MLRSSQRAGLLPNKPGHAEHRSHASWFATIRSFSISRARRRLACESRGHRKGEAKVQQSGAKVRTDGSLPLLATGALDPAPPA